MRGGDAGRQILKYFSTCVCAILIAHSSILLFKIESKETKFVVHAGGSIENMKYLNCKEGFEKSIESGNTLIELDFLFTSDNEIICSHYLEYFPDFSIDNRPTLAQAKETLIAGKFSALTFRQVIETLKIHTDVKIVFDTKESVYTELLNKMLQISSELDFDLKNRMVIQVYSYKNYLEMNEFNFKEYWFTNYKANYLPKKIVGYFDDCENVTTIVLNELFWKLYRGVDFNPNKKIAVHTVNDKNYINFLKNRGVDYVFCDCVSH